MQYQFESLLEDITAAQVKDLIQEEELISSNENIRIFYAVDPKELRTYAFPFGLDSFKEEHYSPEYIVDEHLSLYYLFNSQKSRTLLLDEYLSEFLRFRDFILGHSKFNRFQIQAYHAAFEKFTDGRIREFQDWKDINKVVRQCLPFLIAYSIGLHKRGLDLLKDLIAEKNLAIKIEDFEGQNFSQHFISAFDSHLPGKLAETFFERTSKLIKGYHSKGLIDEKRLVRELSSKYRDCKVADRLISMNADLEKLYLEKQLKQRYVILFLSTTTRVEEFFTNENIRAHFPVIDGKPFNIHRKSAHIFLKMICARNNPNEVLSALKNIENVGENRKRNKELANRIQRVYGKQINEVRESFENFNLLAQYDSFSNAINDAIKSNSTDALVKRLIQLKDIHSQYPQEESVKKAEEDLKRLKLFDLLINAKQVQKSILAVRELREARESDHIRGYAHHIPLLFYLTAYKSNVTLQFIAEAYLRSRNLQPWERSELVVEIAERVDYLIKGLENNIRPEDHLVILLLYLVLPTRNFPESEMPEEHVLKDVKSMLPLLENGLSHLRSEYYYLGSFAARKIKDYKSAIDLSELGLKERAFLGVGRFNHSLCLTYYDKFKQDKKFGTPQLELLHKSLDCGLIALEDYEKHYTKLPNAYVLRKQIGALYNGISYFYSILFEIDLENKSCNLSESLRYLEKLKAFENPNKTEYDTYPEYLHTEAFVRLNQFKENRKVEHLKDALRVIEKAISIVNRSDYISLRNEIVTGLNEISQPF